MNQIFAFVQGAFAADNRIRMDWVWAAFALLLGITITFSAEQGWNSSVFVSKNFLEILPYLALAISAAAYAKATGADNLIAKAFTGNLAIMIAIAALFGSLSPFCSCGVIPLIAALLVVGVPLPAVMAFWVSSPLMDPSMFMLTAGVLGMQFAIAKTIFAFSVGVLGGVVIYFVQRGGFLSDPLLPHIGDGGCGGNIVRNPKSVVWKFWRESARWTKFSKEALSNFLFLTKWLVLAFLLESLMLAYIPGELIAETIGGDDIATIFIAAIVGVPAYLNGYAALPLIAGLIEQGMSAGAGMAFLIGGGISSLPAAIAVYALVRKPVFAIYLLVAVTGAILSGIGYSAFEYFQI